MSKEAWALIKQNKNFNIHVYRNGLSMLIVSLSISCLFVLLAFYFFMHLPERDYYATSGVVAPIQLKSMSTPNYSSQALQVPDMPEDETQKMIPQ